MYWYGFNWVLFRTWTVIEQSTECTLYKHVLRILLFYKYKSVLILLTPRSCNRPRASSVWLALFLSRRSAKPSTKLMADHLTFTSAAEQRWLPIRTSRRPLREGRINWGIGERGGGRMNKNTSWKSAGLFRVISRSDDNSAES